MNDMNIYEKACDIIEKLYCEGKTMVEIYVEYTNKLSGEYEKGRGKSSREDRDLYSEVQGLVAGRIAFEAVQKAGYKMAGNKKFTFWEKEQQ